MNPTTFVARAAAALVAAVAGYSSWQHIVAVALHAGERPSVAHVLPLSIDGLILVGTAAVFEDRHAGRVPRISARWAIVVGIVATLAANVGSAQPTWTARAVAVVPPVAFLLAIEVLARSGKIKPAKERTTLVSKHPAGDLADSANTEVTAPGKIVDSVDNRNESDDLDPRDAAREVYHASVAAGVPISGAALARRFGKSARWGSARVAEFRNNGKVPA